MPIPLLPLLGPLLEVGTTLYNQNQQNKTNIGNKNFQREMFDRQNAYNTPAMQKQRMIDAGMNPNLMYGSGTIANTANVPNVVKSESFQAQAPNISKYADVAQKQAQTAVTTKQMEIMQKELELKDATIAEINARTEGTTIQNQITKGVPLDDLITERKNKSLITATELGSKDADFRSKTINNETLSQRNLLTINEAGSRIYSQTQNANVAQKEALIKEELLKLYRAGINPNDPIHYRIIGKILDNSGVTEKLIEWMKSLGRYINKK